jgi:hypothetical protein
VPPSSSSISHHSIQSGKQILDAVLVRPAPGAEKAALLICHGIGETVGHWLAVQHLLAAHGVASLVFDFSGYGRSSGLFTSRQAEDDAIAGFHWLKENLPDRSVSILGFSLGSGVAAAILSRVPARSLVLCASFTSFRDAAVSCGLPRCLEFVVPPIWRTGDTLRHCSIPVMILHGQNDRLFPLRMAATLKAASAANSELVIAPNVAHNEPHRRPKLSYWGIVISYLMPSVD